MENLRALVYGRDLTPYQRKLAQIEFEKLETSWNSANKFNIDIDNEEFFKLNTNSVGFGDIQITIDDSKMAIETVSKSESNDLKETLQNVKTIIETALNIQDPSMALKDALIRIDKALDK